MSIEKIKTFCFSFNWLSIEFWIPAYHILRGDFAMCIGTHYYHIYYNFFIWKLNNNKQKKVVEKTQQLQLLRK